MFPVRLVGRVVELRDFTLEDVDDALAIVGDERVTNWLSFDRKDRDQAAAMIRGAVERAQNEPRTEYYLAITAPALVGFIRLGMDGVKAGKLGYAVRADQWGRGYATDAARVMLDFGFKELGLHRISGAVGPDNAASVRVLERLGFQFEGRIRDHVFTNDKWRDSLLYSVLASEWAGRQAAA
jgi:RimJ/RimL family protein N-acetyltransferase